MDKEKLMGIVRHVLTFGGGFGVARGWFDEQTMLTLVGAVVSIMGTGWSIWVKPMKKKVT